MVNFTVVSPNKLFRRESRYESWQLIRKLLKIFPSTFQLVLSCHHSSGQNNQFLRLKTFFLVHMGPPSLRLFRIRIFNLETLSSYVIPYHWYESFEELWHQNAASGEFFARRSYSFFVTSGVLMSGFFERLPFRSMYSRNSVWY